MAANPETLQKLKKRLRTVTVEGRSYYVAEGDLLLEADQLEPYAEQQGKPAPSEGDGKKPHELLGIQVGGKIVRWKPGLELTYVVLKQTFAQAEYETVKAAMKQATRDWEKTCGVRFRHLADKDDGAAATGAMFTVRKVNAGGQFIAAAFFPNDPVHRRHVVIDPSFFTLTTFDPVGVLRHELGHVLGFRHEHIRSGAPAVCPQEDLQDTIELSKYDPKSVMHYFCGQVGDRQLRITDVDRVAAQGLYGPPLDSVQYCE